MLLTGEQQILVDEHQLFSEYSLLWIIVRATLTYEGDNIYIGSYGENSNFQKALWKIFFTLLF